MKLAIPDLVSNSYLPAVAAVELGFFAAEGLDMTHELIFPVDTSYHALRDGEVDFVGGSAHSVLAAFPEWRGAKLVCALAQGMYWFLVLRSDLGVKRGDIDAVKGLHIGAAPWVELGLKRLLVEAGIDLEGDKVKIAPIPGTREPGVSFGVAAARALEDGKVDGFWANGMGAEVAVRGGAGTVVLDVRRGDGPAAGFHYTYPILATTDRLIEREPDAVAAAVRGIVRTLQALRDDVGRATEVGRKLFPPAEAEMIADVVERDLPYYDATLSEDYVTGMNRFTRDMGLVTADADYDQVVAAQFAHLWNG